MRRLAYLLSALVWLDGAVYILAHLGSGGSERHAQHALVAATGVEMIVLAAILLIGALGDGFDNSKYNQQGY